MGRLTSPIRTTLMTLVLTLGLAASGTAFADAPPAPSPEQRVDYADLDLSSTDGARVMLDRLRLAAVRACGSGPVHSPLFPRAVLQHDQCVEDAIGAAVTALDAPLVLAFHTNTNPSGAAVLAAR